MNHPMIFALGFMAGEICAFCLVLFVLIHTDGGL